MIWYVFRLVLLVGVSYIVLYPFFAQIMGSFMAEQDLIDATVILIPKNWTLNTYKLAILQGNYVTTFLNTLMISGATAILQTFTCAFIAYGLAKFKFKAGKYIFLAVIVTMVIPHATLGNTMYTYFSKFDILGIFKFLAGGGLNFGEFNYTNEFLANINIVSENLSKAMKWTSTGISLTGTFWPLMIMSVTGLGFKNGLYIFLLRQFFSGVPNELEESAYMDGSGVFRTFVRVIIPLSVPMLITVFIFAFSWQWLDNFYVNKLVDAATYKIPIMGIIPQFTTTHVKIAEAEPMVKTLMENTWKLMIIAPLVILYVFCQNYLVQGIERSGLTAD